MQDKSVEGTTIYIILILIYIHVVLLNVVWSNGIVVVSGIFM